MALNKSALPTKVNQTGTHVNYWIVDGLEHNKHADYARLERPDGAYVHVLLELLPQNLQKGDVLNVQFDSSGFQAIKAMIKP